MANKKDKISTWEQADDILRAIGELEFKRESLEAECTRKQQETKKLYGDKVAVIDNEIKEIEKKLKKFVTEKKADIAESDKGRTRTLIFGKVGVRTSSKIVISNEEETIKLLKLLRMHDAIITKEVPSREALEKYNDATLIAVGARRQSQDSTWYEVDREKFKGIAQL